MPLKREPFEPLPDDTEWVASLEDVDEDEHDWTEDGDDRLVDPTAPTMLARLVRKAARRG